MLNFKINTPINSGFTELSVGNIDQSSVIQNPVLIETPQVEKNVETKNDYTNAFVVLQPAIGDTELFGGKITVNNIDKKIINEISPSSMLISETEDSAKTEVNLNGFITESRTTDNKIQIKNTELKNESTLELNSTSLKLFSPVDLINPQITINQSGLSGNVISITANTDTNLKLSVSGTGHLIIEGLPESNAGLQAGELYTHDIDGGHRTICIV